MTHLEVKDDDLITIDGKTYTGQELRMVMASYEYFTVDEEGDEIEK